MELKSGATRDADPAGVPYPRREALPISYFPFLGAEDGASPGEALAFEQRLGGQPPSGGEALVYVHIPFCESICAFCGFYRKSLAEFSGDLEAVFDAFTGNLVREIRLWAACTHVQDLRIDAVYVGGGSPSILPLHHIDRILGAIRSELPVPHGAEISFEGEARSLRDRAKLGLLKERGVTRVSFGVQSFDPLIRQLCALHPDIAAIYDCAERVRESGFAVNIDLMYGLPGQRLRHLECDLETAAGRLSCAHVDLYDAILYPNTSFFNGRHFYSDLFPTGQERIEMLRLATSFLRSRSFSQITSDDFVLPGAEYRMKFLNFGGSGGDASVLAIGPSAIGFMNGASYRNHALEAYLGPAFDALPIGRIRRASQDELERRPFVFLPKILRTDVSRLRYGVPAETERLLRDQEARGLLRRSRATWELTDLGLEWVDAVACEHLRPAEKRRLFKIVQ